MDYLNMKINKKRELTVKEVNVEEFQLENKLQKKVVLTLADDFSEYQISEGIIKHKKEDKKSIGLWFDIQDGEIDQKCRGIRELLRITNSETLSDLVGKSVPVDNNDLGYLSIKLYENG